MTLSLIIRSLFEFAAVILVIAGLINEKKLIDFEAKLGYYIARERRTSVSHLKRR